MDFYVVSNESLTSVADAIRSKSGKNEDLIYPQEFISEINNLSTNIEISGNNFIDTTENWNNKRNYIPEKGDIIIYSDKTQIIENNIIKNIPGIKIGDGNAHCIDLPFLTDDVAQNLLNHVNDNTRHVTTQEKQFWNNKLNVAITGESLQLTRN